MCACVLMCACVCLCVHVRLCACVWCLCARAQRRVTGRRNDKEASQARAINRVVALRHERAMQKARLRKRLKAEFLQRQRMTAFTRTITRVLLDKMEEQAEAEREDRHAAILAAHDAVTVLQ